MQRKDIPIWRDANRLLLEVEQAVRHFPRYHFTEFERLAVGWDEERVPPFLNDV